MLRRSWWQTWRAGRWALSMGTRSTRWVIVRGFQSIKNKYIYTYSRMFSDNRRPAADDELWRVLHSHQQSWDQQGPGHHEVAQDGLETGSERFVVVFTQEYLLHTCENIEVYQLYSTCYIVTREASHLHWSFCVRVDVSMFDFMVFIGSVFSLEFLISLLIKLCLQKHHLCKKIVISRFPQGSFTKCV